MSSEKEQQNTLTEEQGIPAERETDEPSANEVPEVPQYAAENADVPQPRYRRLDKILTVVLAVLLVILIVCFVLKFFVVCRVTVAGSSMMPNYQDKQIVWVDKTAKIKRGDVVVLYANYVSNKFLAEFSYGENAQNGEYKKLFKRVVAVEGDKLWAEEDGHGNYVLRIETADGRVLYEDDYLVGQNPAVFWDEENNIISRPLLGDKEDLGYLKDHVYGKNEPIVVRENKFYFLGDNRFNSTDSRVMHDVSCDRIYGVVIQK